MAKNNNQLQGLIDFAANISSHCLEARSIKDDHPVYII
jgi:hypothetical protein